MTQIPLVKYEEIDSHNRIKWMKPVIQYKATSLRESTITQEFFMLKLIRLH